MINITPATWTVLEWTVAILFVAFCLGVATWTLNRIERRLKDGHKKWELDMDEESEFKI